MAVPQAFTDFDINAATVALWVFKKSLRPGSAPVFTGRWVQTDEALDGALKQAVIQERARILEVNEYGLLAQNNEDSALRIDGLLTHAGLLTAQMAAEIATKKVRNLKDVQNSDFYAIKLVSGDSILYAVRKTDASWKSKKAVNYLTVLFDDDELTLQEAPSFTVSRHVDFFIIDDDVLMTNKAAFESVLNYKQAHADDFLALQAEPDFSSLFSNIAPLVAFVGTNKLHLRRVCAIRQKGHYRNAAFMDRLRQQHHQFGLVLTFDAQGRIDPTAESCANIIRAFLDHRLTSPFSANVYDVPDTTQIQ
ncbi:protein of unknown function [Xaviernesmea oryzae]|uniref:DUF4868 domain-containing protein n=1 Tax=Xaviernesmea oryzae TaxID=464029 RepID=A0A1X7DZ53_9HYPH|nr:Kiwa anti-phage protein KwaB-like domain-containing protein [Xaviernesmea oryzae]SMF24475.1 protein of unknown function [Xaviernesmea oryzae]